MEKINQEIDVAASFNQKGEIRPIKFRFIKPDEEEIEIKVDRLIRKKNSKNQR